MLEKLFGGAGLGSGMVGTGIAGLTGGAMNSIGNSSVNPDNTNNFTGMGGGLFGAGLGGLGGYLGMKHFLGTDWLTNAVNKASAVGTDGAVEGAAAEAASKGMLKEALSSGKKGLLSYILENPKLMKGGAGALGALIGAKLIGRIFAQPGQTNSAQIMQQNAQTDAAKQQMALIQLGYGGGGSSKKRY